MGCVLAGPSERFARRGVNPVGFRLLSGKVATYSKQGIFEGAYPLYWDVVLALPPEPRADAAEFVALAAGPKGAAACEPTELWPATERFAYLSGVRVVRYKAGKGQRLTAAGDGAWSAWVEALNVEYVKAAEVVQGRYVSVAGATAQVGALVRDKAELAIIAGGLSDEALDVHGADWRKLWAEAKRATPAPASTP
ncbi:MAG: hypothetical protein KGY99_11465, partial [Phycisphaerae bacterium]|nr:hypothetical protein [Phycisphaerae bacterium]